MTSDRPVPSRSAGYYIIRQNKIIQEGKVTLAVNH